MLWSMYFHHRDGGYYWHQIYTFPSVWSYHFPGSPSGDAHCEIGIVSGLREAAFRIQGLPTPPVDAPDAPELLPFENVPMFTWRGSAGAEGYDIERAATAQGPWRVIAENVSDADVAYRPLFSDETAQTGDVWCYRVAARNAGGRSKASNVIGPVKVAAVCFVDEFKELARASGKSDGLTIDNTYNAWYAEYLFRAKGNTNDWLAYSVAGPIREARVTAFFKTGQVRDPAFACAPDNGAFAAVTPRRVERPLKAIPKSDGKRRQVQVTYTLTPPAGMRQVRVTWSGPMALDRVEIEHAE